MALAELAKRELARRELKEFTLYQFLGFKLNWHHEVLFDHLQQVEAGTIKRLMIFMPPRHSKSEIASIQFPAWFIGRNPTKDIVEASYSADLAHDFGRQTRNLIASQEYKNVFEDVALSPDSQAKGMWNTNHGGAYNAVGVGGSLTGKGADILMIDDPVKNREEADSEVTRESTWSWYLSTARTRLSPTGAIVLIMTRWHDDDLAGRILRADPTGWKVLSFPAIATQDEEYRKEGEALWPGQFNLENLLQTKKDLGSYNWSALYQQDPIDTESQEFKKSWFVPIKWADVQAKDTNCFITVDTAVSQRSAADFTGITRNWVDRENKWHLKTAQLKINPTELIDLLFTLFVQDRPTKIGIEKGIYLQALKPFLDEEQRRRNTFLPIVELDHAQVNKETRIRGLIPRYESGSVYHVEGECGELESELLRFPKGLHDDVCDSAAYQLQLARPPASLQAQVRYPTHHSAAQITTGLNAVPNAAGKIASVFIPRR